MKDRQPTQPGRVKLTPENGTAPFYAIMEMADEPTEIGTPPTKTNLLQDETEHALFGNIADRTVNDAFAKVATEINSLRLKTDGVAALSVTLTSAQGNPLANVQILGMFDEDGNTCVTNASGVASGYVADGNVTLSVSNYADIVDYSETFVAEAGQSYTRAMTVTTRNFLKVTTSKNIKFSDNVSHVDASVVGAGAGGAQGILSGTLVANGAGGAGGYVVTTDEIEIVPNQLYPVVVGAGGKGGTYSSAPTGGGNSSAFGMTAQGATASTAANMYTTVSNSTPSTTGTGNGLGGAGTVIAGSNSSSNGKAGGDGKTLAYSSFYETATYGAGGGSGAVNSGQPGAGGVFGGGRGGRSIYGNEISGAKATANTGSGGGGGAAFDDGDAGAGGDGADGVVTMRIHLKLA